MTGESGIASLSARLASTDFNSALPPFNPATRYAFNR